MADIEKVPSTADKQVNSSNASSQEARPTLKRANTERQWGRSKQQIKLLWHLSWRLLITCGLCAITAGVLVTYQNKYIIQDKEKNVFNAVLTGLSIGIGLNVAAGLIQIGKHYFRPCGPRAAI